MTLRSASATVARVLDALTKPTRQYIWRWWHYTMREPLADAPQAHQSLREVSGYRLAFTRPHRIISVRPSLRRFRFGVWVVVEPEKQRGPWTQRWVKWVDDPIELWLLRSAVRGVPRLDREPPAAGRSKFDDISPREMSELFMTPQEDARCCNPRR